MQRLNFLKGLTISTILLAGSLCQGQQLILAYPIDSSSYNAENLRFAWATDTAWDSYTVQIANSTAFSPLFVDSTLMTGNIKVDSLPPGRLYWRVIANGTSSDTSEVSTFISTSPALISAARIWLRADKNVTTDPDGVNLWADYLASSTNQFVQTSASKKPQWRPNVRNGQPALFFDGFADVLQGGDILDVGTSNYSIVIFGKSQSSVGTYYAKAKACGCKNRIAVQRNSAGDLKLFYEDVSSHEVLTSSNFNEWEMLRAEVDRANQKIRFWKNGILIGEDSPVQNDSYDFNSSYRALLGAFNNGSDNGELVHLRGYISEFMIFNDLLSPDDLQVVEGYLKQKYGRQDLSLPILVEADYGFCPVGITADSTFQSYSWSNEDETYTTIVEEGGLYDLTATDSFGFKYTERVVAQFPPVTYPASSKICAGDSVYWNILAEPGYTFLWNDGYTEPDRYLSESGTYSLRIDDTLGCTVFSDTIFFEVDSFSFKVDLRDTSLCAGNLISLSAGAPLVDQFLWSTGSTAAEIPIDSSGLYSVMLTAESGCTAADSSYVTVVGTSPAVDFDFSQPCMNAPSLFTDMSIASGSDSISTWFWDLGDGSTSNVPNPVYEYAATGEFIVQLIVTTSGGCSQQTTDTVSIFPEPTANFSADQSCAGEVISFTNSCTITSGLISEYIWDFDDGDSSALFSPNHIFSSVGIYDVVLTAISDEGCQDSKTTAIEVAPPPLANFEVENACAGSAADFINTSSPGAVGLSEFDWDFGDGNSSDSFNPSNTFDTAGVYNVTLFVTDSLGCRHDTSAQIYMARRPVAGFEVDSVCINAPYTIIDLSAAGDAAISSWTWTSDNFGTSNLSAPEVMWNEGGGDTVLLVVVDANGCRDEFTAQFEILNPPDVVVDIASNSGVIPFYPEVEVMTTDAEFYFWDFGDGSFSTDTFFNHSFDEPGTYSVQLEITDKFGCVNSTVFEIRAEAPFFDINVSNLIATPQGASINLLFQLTNQGNIQVDQVSYRVFILGGEEQLSGTFESLAVGQSAFVTPPGSLSTTESSNIVCVEAWIQNEEETDLEDNLTCVAAEKSFLDVSPAFPNPTDQIITLPFTISAAKQVEILFYNQLGQIALQQFFEAESGVNFAEIDVDILSAGAYHLQLRAGDQFESQIISVY